MFARYFCLKKKRMETVLSISDLYSKAREYEKTEKLLEAVSLYEKVSTSANTYIASFIRLGNIYEMLHLKEKAIATYKRGIAVAEKYGNKKAMRYLSYMLLGLIE